MQYSSAARTEKQRWHRFQRCFFIILELSSQVQQLIEENFKGGSPAEAFTGTKIDLAGKGSEESGIEALQVGGFGAVFANEPIGVLVRPAHPGRVRRRKEKGNVVQRSGDFVVFGKLLATIRRDGAYQFRREFAK